MSRVKLSICIVTYQARKYLRQCLQSVAENPPSVKYEIIVVDNQSADGTLEMLKGQFPQVQIIENRENKGFTAPTNQALRQAVGDYLVLLNPDTHVHPQAFDNLIAFMKRHPDAGICGPKVLNLDGSMQKPCRRGESRPWAVFSYFLGFSRLFPKSKLFGEYLMNYIDEDLIHQVAGVSGSCMLIRRQVIDQIGYLDELFFAYQEDADYCLQARRSGWNVYYVPTAHITHYGGEGGSRVHPYRSIYAWHYSYFLYFRKNFASDYFFLLNWLFYLAMGVKLLLALILNLFRKGRFAGSKEPV